MAEPPTPAVPESPMDRAMERVTDEAPVEILRGPTKKGTVQGPKGRRPPPRSEPPPTHGRTVLHPDAHVRELAAEFLTEQPPARPVAEPRPEHAERSAYKELQARAAEFLEGLPHLREQGRDHLGRFASGSGGGAGKTPADLHDGDEAYLRGAYEFKDGPTGLSVEMHSVRQSAGGGVTYASLYIRNQDGEIVGVAEHAILPAQQRTARLDGLAISEGQGQGFGARYMDHVEKVYRDHGIERITLTANIDVGGYAWARDGYDFAEPTQRGSIAAHARDHSRRYNTDVQAQVRAVADNPLATPLDFAMIGWQPGASTWPGKQIMLGSSWDGVKTL